MGSGYLLNPLVFLITTVFGLYILAVMLRFLLQWARADFHNPISQLVVRVTNPPLKPLRRVIPGLAGLDIASVVLMLALQFLSLYLVTLFGGQPWGVGTLLVLSVSELTALLINVFIVSILIQVVLSWVNPGSYNPVGGLLYSLNEPLLRPVRRAIPPMSGLDLSSLVVLIGLQILKMLIIPPLEQLAIRV